MLGAFFFIDAVLVCDVSALETTVAAAAAGTTAGW
jgi:hypothetical protein